MQHFIASENLVLVNNFFDVLLVKESYHFVISQVGNLVPRPAYCSKMYVETLPILFQHWHTQLKRIHSGCFEGCVILLLHIVGY